MESPKRIVLVEDEPRTAACIQALLESTGELEVRVAATLREGERLALAGGVDAAIVDLGLPDGDGVELIGMLHARERDRPILALTSATGSDRILASFRAGAVGYLFKDDVDVRLIAAVSDLCAGGSPLSPGAARTLVEHARTGSVATAGPKLTRREKGVLELLASGAGYAEMARETDTSINTVRTHVRALYVKLDAENRAEAVNAAWRLGLLRTE